MRCGLDERRRRYRGCSHRRKHQLAMMRGILGLFSLLLLLLLLRRSNLHVFNLLTVADAQNSTPSGLSVGRSEERQTSTNAVINKPPSLTIYAIFAVISLK